ncbi:BTB/POZ domain protein [Ancylostoma caninum]|uniref:BTB/POZ domain protein n=1 Tax=Ancylostoma caninum TaxID=29170 RepID=A0A368GGC4_ANCCA|nr:BTB/POZ domain protein [Ancylostoma caninum]
MSLQTDNFLGNFGFNFDFDACINVRSSKEGNDIDEPVLAHRLVLSSASTRFRNLLAAGQQESPIAKIDIDLREIPNSINAFKAMLSGLYTGELNFALADHSEILAVARHCEVPTIESKLLAASHQEPAPFAALFSQQKFPTIAPNPPCRKQLMAEKTQKLIFAWLGVFMSRPLLPKAYLFLDRLKFFVSPT